MERLRIGILFELLGTGTAPNGSGSAAPDADAEYEPEETIALLERALRVTGHEPVRLGGPRDLLPALGEGRSLGVDAALNISEGQGSRNREAFGPVLLELAGVPTLGSDALSLSLSLDKAWALDRVAQAGVRVAPHQSLEPNEDLKIGTFPASYPLFVKPRWEGTAKGILPESKVTGAAELAAQVERIWTLYQQPALVQPFLPGAEYTVTVVGHRPARALPVLQRGLETNTGIGLHVLERDSVEAPAGGWEHHMPGELNPALETELQAQALRAFHALGCLDFARADFRLDAAGEPTFLEINPLPTFAPEGSFAILAELEGRSVEALLAEVFSEGLARLGLS